MTDNTQTQFNEDGFPTSLSTNKENDNSPASSAGKETTGDQTQTTEEDNSGEENKNGAEKKDEQNFADHPRWQEREDDWKKRFNEQEERHTTELTKIREDIDNKFKTSRGDENVEIPSWFGSDDPAVWKAYQSDFESKIAEAKKSAKEEAVSEIIGKTTSEQKAIKEATEFFNDTVATIENDKTLNPDSLKVDRNKLLKFVLDNELVDTKGRWNYKAGWMMMNTQSNLGNDKKDRKNLASATTSDKGAETKPPTLMTSEDFSKPENRPW